MNITITELKDILSGIDIFVPNVGLTTLKKVKMNKYLDFKENGKSNPNPYRQKLIARSLEAIAQETAEAKATAVSSGR